MTDGSNSGTSDSKSMLCGPFKTFCFKARTIVMIAVSFPFFSLPNGLTTSMESVIYRKLIRHEDQGLLFLLYQKGS